MEIPSKPFEIGLIASRKERTALAGDQAKVAESDRNQDGLGNRLEITLVRNNAARGRKLNTVTVAIVRSVVKAGRATEDIDRIIMPAEKTICGEAKILRAMMALDVIGKGHLKPTANFAIDID
jgi:hypothetical protein